MTQFSYLGALLLSLGGLATLDYHFKLAFWVNKKATLLTVTCTMAFFLLWDVAGILLDIFYDGSSKYSLQFHIIPQFPVEELFFLALLAYVTLLIWRGSERIWQRT